MKTLILVDVSQLVYACVSVKLTKKLDTNIEELVTSSINSNIYSITSGSSDFIPILVFDSRPSFRVSIYPEYKGNRVESNIDWEVIEQYLSERFMYLKYPLLEADDLIYLISKAVYNNNVDNPAIIISSDSDLQQVVYKTKAKQFCPKTKNYKIYESNYDWQFKLFLGDSSDNIPRSIASEKDGKPFRLGLKTLRKDLIKEKSLDKVAEKYNLSMEDEALLLNYRLIVFDTAIYDLYIDNFNELSNYLDKITSLLC